MPAATTHVEFSKDVYRLLDEETKKKITNMNMFYLGSNGPDFLFFSHASILPGSLKKYGHQLHAEKVKEAMAFLDDYSKNDNDLRSFFYGYLCHYALDALAHPLVNAMARKRHEDTGVHEGEIHVTLEADIDVWMLNQRGRTIKDYDVYKHFKISNDDCKKLAHMIHELFREVFYTEVNETNIAVAIREIRLWTFVLSPNKYIDKSIYTLENLIKMPHALSGMVLYNKNDIYALNIYHESYPLTFDSIRSISKSFPEIYGEAALWAEELIRDPSKEEFAINFEGEPY